MKKSLKYSIKSSKIVFSIQKDTSHYDELRAKFGRIKTRTNLLQRLDNNFGHFNNKFCYKVHKKIYGFSDEIADCCSIRLATLP